MESREHYVAAQVRAEMARRGLKQKDLAEVLGMTQQAVSPKHSGHRPYSQADLWTISDWLGIPFAELLGEAGREVHPLDRPQPPTGSRRRARRDSNSRPTAYSSPSWRRPRMPMRRPSFAMA